MATEAPQNPDQHALAEVVGCAPLQHGGRFGNQNDNKTAHAINHPNGLFWGKKINLTGWFLHFGGFGLILFGLIDNSAIPLPGGMDLLTTWLAAGRQRPWFYYAFLYAFLATVGPAIGACTTYRLRQKGSRRL